MSACPALRPFAPLAIVLAALLAAGNASASILPGSLFVTVVDPISGSRITDATVTLNPGGLRVTDNLDGVYAFPVLTAGTYMVTVTTPCYPAKTQSVSVNNGTISSLLVQLSRYPMPNPRHSADTNSDSKISLSEYLRVVQFYNSGGYHCQAGTEDGYAPGPGSTSCTKHNSDYNPGNWVISMSELLRLSQFYNAGGYHKQSGTEDGYAPDCYY